MELLKKQALKRRTGEFDLESIYILDLSDQALNDLQDLNECTGLINLNLSANEITNIDAVSTLINLVSLNLSSNKIIYLDPLSSCINLELCNLAGNLIGSLEQLKPLVELQKLENLSLRDPVEGLSNPLCLTYEYRQNTVKTLPQLKLLDGECLKGPGSDLFETCRNLQRAIEESALINGPLRERPLPKSLYDDENFWGSTGESPEERDVQRCLEHFSEVLKECHTIDEKRRKFYQNLNHKFKSLFL